MPTGLVALLDDVAVIARAAAASIDDVSVGVAKAGTKAAGVVIDDTAVTPGYVTDFTPDRELPVIWKIAKGSLFNKLVILLPIALLLSIYLPQAIIVLLLLGGSYLSFEGAEKVMEKLGGEKHGKTLDDPIEDIAEFENQRVKGAIRTDLILSAEIMAISLAEIAGISVWYQAPVLAILGVVLTIAVYGTVALLVKMDDIGLHLAKKDSNLARTIGRGMVQGMPKVLNFIAVVGTVAMLWVGGGILLHSAYELGWDGPEHFVEAIGHAVEGATGALGGVLGWIVYAACSAIVGLVYGGVIAFLVEQVMKARGKSH